MKSEPKKLSEKITDFIVAKRPYRPMRGAKRLTIVGVMAALANVLSYPGIAIPLVIGPFESSIHFLQLPIILGGVLAGPIAGLMAGAIGGLYMASTKIPFIVGGQAIFGCSAGFFAKKIRPFLAGTLAWGIQAPYVLVTDYVWFTLFLQKPSWVAWMIITPIMIKLTIEIIICSVIADVLVKRIKD